MKNYQNSTWFTFQAIVYEHHSHIKLRDPAEYLLMVYHSRHYAHLSKGLSIG